MRAAIEEASESQERGPSRRYSIRSQTAWRPAGVVTRVPLSWTGSTDSPTVVQALAKAIVFATRATGMVTVSSTPQPGARTPAATTEAPLKIFRETRGPTFAESETRTASVPAGTVPALWQIVASPPRV